MSGFAPPPMNHTKPVLNPMPDFPETFRLIDDLTCRYGIRKDGTELEDRHVVALLQYLPGGQRPAAQPMPLLGASS